MEVVAGGDKACLPPENSPGCKGERTRRKKRTLVMWMDKGWEEGESILTLSLVSKEALFSSFLTFEFYF